MSFYDSVVASSGVGSSVDSSEIEDGSIVNADISASANIALSKLASTPLVNVVEDTTPQLGGDLDVNGNDITSIAGLNISTGSSAGHDFTIGTNKFVLEGDTGRIGVGTANPQAKIEALGDGAAEPNSDWFADATFGITFLDDQTQTAQLTAFAGDTALQRPLFFGRRSRGTLDTPTAVADNDWLFSLTASGHDGTNFEQGAAINFEVDGAVSMGVVPTAISFETGDDFDDRAERLRIDPDGLITMSNGAYLSSPKINENVAVTATATELNYVDGVTSAIQTQLNAKLANVSEDTTPTLGGTLDGADKNITGLGRVSFTQELDNGEKSSNFSIDFGTDQKQKVTLTANTMTLTLDTTFDGVGNYLLKIVNGGLATLTWASESGSVLWAGGSAPTLTSSGTDIVSFYYDGINWYGSASLDFS